MATNNKNNASQTLFRFVSLRNPKLTETKEVNLGFIHRPIGLISEFDNILNPNDTALAKFQALERAAKNFNPGNYKTEHQLEQGILSEVLKIGRKISKMETLSSADEISAKNLYNDSAIQGVVSKVWDNLIYQTVTQKNFYTKEALIHILKALHFGFVCNSAVTPELTKINGDNLKAKALEARVVLPMAFFGNGNESGSSSGNITNNNSFQVNVSQIGDGTINGQDLPITVQQQLKTEGKRISEQSYLTLQKDELAKLKSELEKIQASFYTLRTKAYEAFHKEYLNKNKDILNKYDDEFARISALINDKMNQEEIDALYAQLDRIIIPDFEFDYRNELNFEDLSTKLSKNSFKLFVEYFTLVNNGNPLETELDYSLLEILSDKNANIRGISIAITEEYDTYAEIYKKLDEEIESRIHTLFAEAPIQEQKFANIGNVLVPVAKTTYTEISGTYYLNVNIKRSISATTAYLSFFYNTDSDSLGLLSASVEMAANGQNFQQDISAIDVVDGKVILPVIAGNVQHVSSVKIILYFKNGEYTVIQHDNITSGQEYTGKFVFRTKTEEDGNGENPGSGSETFTRNNFGIKRLGVADYLKVVQSVHAYVPGEVSNIENVMASELRHKSSVARDYSEITDTTSKSQETEKISDTSKTSRTDMQTEVAKELEKQQSITAYTHYSYDTAYKLDIGADYANNTAQHDSTRQAVMKSQEITERAMERVLTKISEERVQKIIKEYTETNVHEFDNRGKVTETDNSETDPKHITGVYRWIDKKMKNQIYNYGKRTMFEFMVPEPARLHRLSLTVGKGKILTAPVDPRKADRPYNMPNSKAATKELLQYWADIYGVKLTDLPKEDVEIYQEIQGGPNSTGSFGAVGTSINITQNYAAKNMKLGYYMKRNRSTHNSECYCSDGRGGERNLNFGGSINQGTVWEGNLNIVDSFNFIYRGRNIDRLTFNVTLYCKLSDSFTEQWKTENFNAIIAAYEEAYKKFQEEQARLDAEQGEKEAEAKEKVGSFYRYMEHDTLKHNCIAYLLQDYLNILGQSFTDGDKMENFQVYLSEDLDRYTALAKFMEQAFEWEIMDYTFYPYYWANRKMWQEMYISESTDPLFRSFLQAGMARIIVTVKPGFEDAVQFFLSTGKIWNGGEVPVIGDPMYMSIVDEMRQPTGEPQGKYWITRIPTTLTILQDKSTGLPVDQPLPIFPEDNPKNCENPKELELETSFNMDKDIRLQHSNGTTTLPSTIIKPI